jgi:hypothetical protein
MEVYECLIGDSKAYIVIEKGKYHGPILRTEEPSNSASPVSDLERIAARLAAQLIKVKEAAQPFIKYADLLSVPNERGWVWPDDTGCCLWFMGYTKENDPNPRLGDCRKLKGAFE